MNKIFVFGEFDSTNVGDVLIGLGQDYVYKHCDLDAKMIPLELYSRKDVKINTSNKIVKPSRRLHRFFYKKSYYYRHLLEFTKFLVKKNSYFDHSLKSIDGSRVVIIGGGQLFNDNSLRMILRIYCLLKSSQMNNIKTYIVGAGMPRPKTLISRYMTKSAVRLLPNENIFFRDSKSITVANEFYSLDLTEDNIIPDFAISYINQFSSPTPSVIKKVGLAPISKEVLPKSHLRLLFNHDIWWVELAKYLISKNIEPIIFCSGSIEDYSRCLDIKKLALESGLNIELLPRPLSASSFIDNVNGLDNVVAQRLHVSITSYSLGKRPISLPWDDKVKCFYNEIGLPDNYLVEDDISFSTIHGIITSDSVEPICPQIIIDRSSTIIKNVFG
ncbi:polysaccharide pyruvyl transferase family protein [Vibrio splendidus]|uniref:polysaccharide pyruvyl transferase family protein n=1 Tax=Vibrio splendidus TaxID=29497 RepID=UPI001FB5212E|nr:polysaccharide pyruvyl transferase family protein [Vibrio splendidus]UOE85838.1 polysaccharide pyruvyl transferase family protein [Vibrio splendidus]